MSATSGNKGTQSLLVEFGYLPKGADDGHWGRQSVRALTRFQRRAATTYRLSSATGLADDCSPAEVFAGLANGTLGPDTITELDKWKTRKWKAPLGRLKFKNVAGGTLRESAAEEWTNLVTKIKGLGGTLDPPYGDTRRGLHKANKDGASSFSFHIVGRAVDINEHLNDRKHAQNPFGHRVYWVAKDPQTDGMYFRIYCLTSAQDGSQGDHYDAGEVKCWDFADRKEIKLPEGYYLDLTDEIESGGKFERIKAHHGWEHHYTRSEWWHHQYSLNIQATFQDECELVGYSEKDMLNAGYTQHDLDHKPG